MIIWFTCGPGLIMGYKIVRDFQREFCEKNGISGSWRVSEHPVNGLTKKLFEEAGEFAEHHDPSELYDLRDVLNELIYLTDPLHEHREAHADKVNRMGKFTRHLEWSPNPHEQMGFDEKTGIDPR